MSLYTHTKLSKIFVNDASKNDNHFEANPYIEKGIGSKGH